MTKYIKMIAMVFVALGFVGCMATIPPDATPEQVRAINNYNAQVGNTVMAGLAGAAAGAILENNLGHSKTYVVPRYGYGRSVYRPRVFGGFARHPLNPYFHR